MENPVAGHLLEIFQNLPEKDKRFSTSYPWSKAENCGDPFGCLKKVYNPEILPGEKSLTPKQESMRNPMTNDSAHTNGCGTTTVILRVCIDSGVWYDGECREFFMGLCRENDNFIGTPEDRFNHVMGYLSTSS